MKKYQYRYHTLVRADSPEAYERLEDLNVLGAQGWYIKMEIIDGVDWRLVLLEREVTGE